MQDPPSEEVQKVVNKNANFSVEEKSRIESDRVGVVPKEGTAASSSRTFITHRATAISSSQSTAGAIVDTNTKSVVAAAAAAAPRTTTDRPATDVSLPPPLPSETSISAAAVPTETGQMAHHHQQQQQRQQPQHQKRQFLLFVKILFKILDQNHDVSAEKRQAARAIVADCTRRNRLGDPACTPLMAAVDARLRQHLGEQHWRRAHVYLRHYMNREAARTRLPLPVGSQTAAV